MIGTILRQLLTPMTVGLMGLFALIFVVWAFGADIDRIFGTDIFARHRVLIVVLLVACWLVFMLVQKILAIRRAMAIEKQMRDQAQEQVASSKPTDRQAMAEVETQLKEAMQALKASKLGKSALYTLPWYMIIGPPGSGKSTALQESGLKFPYMSQGRKGGIRGVGGTRNCDWWFTDQGILLDTAGRYTSQLEDRDEWMGFLSLVKKTRPRNPINGAIVAIGMDELLNGSDSQLQGHAENIRGRLDELRKNLEEVFPVYVLFTKCDLMNGFVDIFEDMGREQRDQVWGFTMPYQRMDTESYVRTFLDETKNLYERLGTHRNGALAVDRSPAKKKRIYTFPHQYAMARKKIADFVRELCHTTAYEESPLFRGFYFSSGTQEGKPIDQVVAAMQGAFGVSGSPAQQGINDPSAGGEKKSYFLNHLFTQVMFTDKDLAQSSAGAEKRRKIVKIAVAAASVLVAAFFGYRIFSNHRDASKVIGDVNIATKRVADAREGNDRFARLDALMKMEKVADELDARSKNTGLGIGMFIYKDQDEHRKAAREVRDREVELLLARPCKMGMRREILVMAKLAREPELSEEMKTAFKVGSSLELRSKLKRVIDEYKEFCHFDPLSPFDIERVKKFLRDPEYARWLSGLATKDLNQKVMPDTEVDVAEFLRERSERVKMYSGDESRKAYTLLEERVLGADRSDLWARWFLDWDREVDGNIADGALKASKIEDAKQIPYATVIAELALTGSANKDQIFPAEVASRLAYRASEVRVPDLYRPENRKAVLDAFQKAADRYANAFSYEELDPAAGATLKSSRVKDAMTSYQNEFEPSVKSSWTDFFRSITLVAPTSLGERAEVLSMLGSAGSPLRSLVTDIFDNRFLEGAPGPVSPEASVDAWLKPCEVAIGQVGEGLKKILTDGAVNPALLASGKVTDIGTLLAQLSAADSAIGTHCRALQDQDPKRRVAAEFFNTALGNVGTEISADIPRQVNALWKSKVYDPLRADYLSKYPFSNSGERLRFAEFPTFFHPQTGTWAKELRATFDKLVETQVAGKPLIDPNVAGESGRWSYAIAQNHIKKMGLLMGTGSPRVLFNMEFSPRNAVTSLLVLGGLKVEFPIERNAMATWDDQLQRITFSIVTGTNQRLPEKTWTGQWAMYQFLQDGTKTVSNPGEAGFAWFGDVTGGNASMEIRFKPHDPDLGEFFRTDFFTEWSSFPSRIVVESPQ